jgi:DNA-binding beta-propeller fold protein YncE
MAARMMMKPGSRFRTALVSLLLAGTWACGGGAGNSDDPAGGETADGGGPSEGGAPAADLEDVVIAIDGVEVATLAGSDVAGTADGEAASFHNPVNVLLDGDGNLIVADYDNNRVRLLSSDGVADTLMQEPNFARPFGLTFTEDGMILVETDYNEEGQAEGTGNGVLWMFDPSNGAATPAVTGAGKPRGLATLPNGLVVLSDLERHDLRLYNPANGDVTALAGKAGSPGFSDGEGEAALFNRPYGVVIDGDGSILVADQMNHSIRRVTLEGKVTTLAGTGDPDMIDGEITDAQFNMPQDLAIDAQGNVFVSDSGNHRIRRISTSGKVETVAGDGTAGFKDGEGIKSRFFGQEGIDVTADGKTLYVADGTGGEPEPYNRVRKITLP